MIKILVVEDDVPKSQAVCHLLKSLNSDGSLEFTAVPDILTAKKHLTATQFDLVIVDAHLPDRHGSQIVKNGGIELVKEIKLTASLKKPHQIIGLTAFDEAISAGDPEFRDALWWMIKYEASSNDWAKRLEARIKYLKSAKSPDCSEIADYDYDLACITALHFPEFQAVQDLPIDWVSHRMRGDATEYLTGKIETNEGQLRVVAASASQMGMPPAASLATKLIFHFRPRFLCMTGIAAGLRDKSNYGDVLVAEHSWDYNSGKLSSSEGKDYFTPDPRTVPLHSTLRERFAQLAASRKYLDDIKSAWRGEKPSASLELRVGPLLSGSAVIANSQWVARLSDQSRKLVGIEMETYGVFYAAEVAPKPRPVAISLKSVCDFADETKDDRFQTYAAFTSARYFYQFAKNEIASLLHAI